MEGIRMTDASTTLDADRYPRVARFLQDYSAGPGVSTPIADLSSDVGRCEVADAPFAAAAIDDFLPRDLYDNVLSEWTTLALKPVAVGQPDTKHVGSRHSFRLHNWKPSVDAPSGVWDTISQIVRATPFVTSLFTRFADTVEANLAHRDLEGCTQAGFRLWANQDSGAAEALGAHVDSLPKLLTIVLYLDLSGPTTPASPRHWGTSFYEIEPDSVKTVDFSANAARTPAGNIEFRPNRAFVMPNTSHALHGVAGGEAGITRRSLMWGYWYTRPRT
jgi:hypothetical protein